MSKGKPWEDWQSAGAGTEYIWHDGIPWGRTMPHWESIPEHHEPDSDRIRRLFKHDHKLGTWAEADED